jgi:Domain of unknown function (DUF4177)
VSDPWEYRVEPVKHLDPSRLQHILNWLGSEGWELVGLTHRVKGVSITAGRDWDTLAILKRPGRGAFDSKVTTPLDETGVAY